MRDNAAGTQSSIDATKKHKVKVKHLCFGRAISLRFIVHKLTTGL